jgi:hypothetical protein
MANPFDEVCKAAFQYHNDRIKQIQQWRYWSIAAYVTFTGFVYYAISRAGVPNCCSGEVSPAFYYALLLLHLGVGFISLLLVRLLAGHLEDRCDKAEGLLRAWRKEVAKKMNSEVDSLSDSDLWLEYQTPVATPVSSAQSWFFLLLISGDTVLIMLKLESQLCNPIGRVICIVAIALLVLVTSFCLTRELARKKPDKPQQTSVPKT